MTLLNSAVIGKVLTGYVSGSGTVAATDTILQAVNKLNGNDALKSPIADPTFTGTVVLPTPFTIGAVSMTATGTELNYVAGVTSAIQTQMNLKAPKASPTFTGVITNALGALGTPSYTFTGDLDTGMWSSGADTLDFSTAGVNRLSIAATGASTFTAVGDRVQSFTSDDHVTVSLKCLGSTKTSSLRYAQGSTVAYDLAMGTGATPTFSLYSYIGSVGTILSATTAGAWSFGPASAAANYNGQRHYISGGLAASNVTSADGSGTLYIGVNSYKSGYTASSARTDTTSGGMGISLANRTVSTSNGFEMFSSLPGESVSTSSVIASATHAGAWTFPTNTVHLFGNTTTVTDCQVQIKTEGTKNAYLSFFSGTSQSYIGVGPAGGLVTSSTAGDLQIANTDTAKGISFGVGTGVALCGRISNAGAWTLGPANTNNSNIINGKLTVQQGSSGVNQTLVVSTAAVVSTLSLEVTSATSGNYVQVYSELHPTADTTLNGAVMQFNVARNTNTAFATKNTFSWSNYGTTQGSISAAGAWTLGVTTAGFVGNSIAGARDGMAVDAGYVGEVQQSLVTTAQLTTTVANVTSLSLSAGIWLVTGMVSMKSSPNTRTYLGASITTTTGGSGTNGTTLVYSPAFSDGASTSYGQARPASQVFNFSSTTTVYLTGSTHINSSSAADCGELTAVRIA